MASNFSLSCSISLFRSPLSALALMMCPMQSGLKFTDRIIQYVAKWAERKTKPASLSKGHVISRLKCVLMSLLMRIVQSLNSITFQITLNINMTPLNNHLTISKIFIILYLTLTVSFAHSTFCVFVFYFYFYFFWYCCYMTTMYNLFAHSSLVHSFLS